jgi:peptidylprolyl isomerase
MKKEKVLKNSFYKSKKKLRKIYNINYNIFKFTKMKSFFKILFFLLFIKNAMSQDLTNLIYLELKDGRVVIEMKPDYAPEHVKRIKELISKKFYDGLKFHRVIDGFMAQTGDPRGDGTGGSGQNIPAEFNSLPHIRGTVSMARAQDPDSADSQFFICFQESSFLDGQYTAWGQVVKGMEFVDKIKRGEGSNGMVNNPDTIISMKLAESVKK